MKTYRQAFILLPFFLLILVGCSNKAAEEMVIKDSLEKDYIMKDSIAKVEAAAAEMAKSESPTLANNLSSNTNAPRDRNFIKTANIKFRVKNVAIATEKIEDLTAKFDGYVKSSRLANRSENYSREIVRKDSVLISQQIVVENQMILRVPNEKLDSLFRAMNPLITFLDYRAYNMDDVTFKLLKNIKDATRLKKYDQRQTAHIDYKDSKLKETTGAEEDLLEKQRQSDDLQISNQEISDQVKYCTITLNIYQKPVIIREVLENFNAYGSKYKPNILSRIWESAVSGWRILEEIILFIINLWSIILLILIALYFIRLFLKTKSDTNKP